MTGLEVLGLALDVQLPLYSPPNLVHVAKVIANLFDSNADDVMTELAGILLRVLKRFAPTDPNQHVRDFYKYGLQLVPVVCAFRVLTPLFLLCLSALFDPPPFFPNGIM